MLLPHLLIMLMTLEDQIKLPDTNLLRKQANKQVVKVKGQDVVIGEAASDDLPDSCHSDDGSNSDRDVVDRVGAGGIAV